jgi:signal transduction histidine kinase
MALSTSAERTLTVRLENYAPNRARITVADTGRGIAPEHLDKIFTYGFTTKAQGSGFGLHSSALAISALGGDMQVHSEGVDRGAVFTAEFPLTADAEAAVAAHDDAPGELVETVAT